MSWGQLSATGQWVIERILGELSLAGNCLRVISGLGVTRLLRLLMMRGKEAPRLRSGPGHDPRDMRKPVV